MTRTLFKWKATRSGDCLTLHGKDAQGVEQKVAGVIEVTRKAAKTKDGDLVRLA